MKEEDENNSHPIENDGEIENVRVVVRVRPMDKSELESGCENCVKVDKINRCITVVKPNAPVTEPPKNYYFDNVFAEDSTQVRVFIDIYICTDCVYNYNYTHVIQNIFLHYLYF